MSLHYTQQRALDKLGYTIEEFFEQLEYFTYVKKMPVADICKMFPQVSSTFIRNFQGWIDFIYLDDEQVSDRIRKTYNDPVKRSNIIKKIKDKNVGKKRSKQARINISNGCKGRKISQEQRNKISVAVKKNHNAKEWHEKQSLKLKEFYSQMSSEEKQEYLKNFVKAGRSGKNKNTSIELKIKKQLDDLEIKYIQQKFIKNNYRSFFLDFYIPSLKLVIECNGDYWHNLPQVKQRDKELKEYVESTGRKIIFIWEHEIKDDWFQIEDYLWKEM